MNIVQTATPAELGQKAAEHAANSIRAAIERNGEARIVLSTGASQFETLDALIWLPVDWSRVTMFHLDEYIGLPEKHPASFRKYLKERFIRHVGLKAAHLVNGEDDPAKIIRELTDRIQEAPIDLALIGIGENAHIAFNDPPADFDTDESFIVVNLDLACKRQQVREGWFPGEDDVPAQAITMTVSQIMKSREIISCVPHESKAEAIRLTLESPLDPQVPSTMLKNHDNWTLYVDRKSGKHILPQT